MVDVSAVGAVSVPKEVGVGRMTRRTFRRRKVRYPHPLGCQAIDLGKPPQWCAMNTAVVHGRRVGGCARGVKSEACLGAKFLAA